MDKEQEIKELKEELKKLKDEKEKEKAEDKKEEPKESEGLMGSLADTGLPNSEDYNKRMENAFGSI